MRGIRGLPKARELINKHEKPQRGSQVSASLQLVHSPPNTRLARKSIDYCRKCRVSTPVWLAKRIIAISHIQQGFNKYYPPDFDGQKHGSLNEYRGMFCTSTCSVSASEHTLSGKHALGDRARKIDQGILVVRFEMPFNIWWYVLKNSMHMSLPLTSFIVGHARTTSEWVFVTMPKRRKSAIIIPPRYTLSGASVICVVVGSRYRRTRRCVSVHWTPKSCI